MDKTETLSDSVQDPADLLRDAVESLSEGLAVFDADQRLVTYNSRYVEMLSEIADVIRPGASWRGLLEACLERNVYAERMNFTTESIDRLANNPSADLRAVEIEQSNGRTYNVSYRPTKSGGFVVTRTDITERRVAEERLRESEKQLKVVLDTIPLPIVMARKTDGHIIFRSAEAWKDYDPDMPRAQGHFVNPEDRAVYVAALEKFGSVSDFRVDLRRADGSVYHATFAGRLVEYDGEEYVVSAINDLSERLDKEELLRHVVDACPTPLIMTRLDNGEVLFSSPEARALFGETEPVASEPSVAFYADPADRDRYVEDLKKNGFVHEYKVLLRAHDGREFWSASSARLIRFRGEDVIVAHVRDLTNQIAMEEELDAQRALVFQNEKMSALGELLAGVAHELNNPLSVVVGHALMLLDEDTSDEVRRHVEKISKSADRCARIVRTFLTMARQRPAKFERVDLNDIARTAVDVARYGETGDLRIVADLAEPLPVVKGDPDQIVQVVLNLILNAEQAIAESGLGDRIRVLSRPAEDGERVEIVVEDNGPGVPKALRGRIFDPFFTTKGVGEGTGIGLALSHRIMHSHGGTILLDPAAQDCTRFVLSLPVCEVEETKDAAAPQPAAPGRTQRVLIVDDEIDVAELNGEILSREGYEVEVTSSVDRAEELLAQKRFDLVLSDLNMPDRDGRNLYETIRDNFPGLVPRTGFITGDTMGQTSQTFLREAGRPFAEKPLSPAELAAFARSILDGEGAAK